MIGAANRTKRTMVAEEKIHDMSQWVRKSPAPMKGMLAMPAAIAQSNADWIIPNTKKA